MNVIAVEIVGGLIALIAGVGPVAVAYVHERHEHHAESTPVAPDFADIGA